MSALSPQHRRGRLELINTALTVLCITLTVCLGAVIVAVTR